MLMADQEEDDLKMAMKLSMQQHESPEPKRSKPRESSAVGGDGQQPEESPEVRNRRIQRELMAAAAERRIAAARGAAATAVKNVEGAKDVESSDDRAVEGESAATAAPRKDEYVQAGQVQGLERDDKGKRVAAVVNVVEGRTGISGASISTMEADKLFCLIFGSRVSKDVLAQWCNQGIRFSTDPDTAMGLVQHEGGPCGVLAAIQAFVLKYLLFSQEDSENVAPNMQSKFPLRKDQGHESVAADIFPSFSDGERSRALVRSMREILFLCGHSKRAVIASLGILGDAVKSVDEFEDEAIAKALGGLSVESGSDLLTILRVDTCTSQSAALHKLEAMLPIFRSRMGALFFLISALLSRGLDNVQEDRDDPSLPLVTTPFGHASQEIVNLLLSGSAVANVFDGNMDLGGGMFVKGISTTMEVGFLTLLESLNLCKVGQYLKCPRWPIWVVGSESHYTDLFALDTKVQEENELENRETLIRRAFDAQDQSGGGGFINVEGFHQVVREANIKLPPEKVELLCSTGFIVWSEFWQALLELDKSLGGVKDSTGMLGKKVFDLYHFNGIAKSIANDSQQSGNENPIQRPRLTKLKVSVPPKWTRDEFMADRPDTSSEASKSPPAQLAPLVDCIRTRWPRSVCNWEGDAPSIV